MNYDRLLQECLANSHWERFTYKSGKTVKFTRHLKQPDLDLKTVLWFHPDRIEIEFTLTQVERVQYPDWYSLVRDKIIKDKIVYPRQSFNFEMVDLVLSSNLANMQEVMHRTVTYPIHR